MYMIIHSSAYVHCADCIFLYHFTLFSIETGRFMTDELIAFCAIFSAIFPYEITAKEEIKEAAKQLNVSTDKCIVFEDVVQGIMAGKNAGMKVVAVYDEASSETTEEKKRLADYYVESIDDFIEYYCK